MIYNNNIDNIMKQIKHIMIDNDIRQSDIVARTGQSKGTISNLLNCKSKNITLDTLLMLCNAIDCQLDINIISKWKYWLFKVLYTILLLGIFKRDLHACSDALLMLVFSHILDCFLLGWKCNIAIRYIPVTIFHIWHN